MARGAIFRPRLEGLFGIIIILCINFSSVFSFYEFCSSVAPRDFGPPYSKIDPYRCNYEDTEKFLEDGYAGRFFRHNTRFGMVPVRYLPIGSIARPNRISMDIYHNFQFDDNVLQFYEKDGVKTILTTGTGSDGDNKVGLVFSCFGVEKDMKMVVGSLKNGKETVEQYIQSNVGWSKTPGNKSLNLTGAKPRVINYKDKTQFAFQITFAPNCSYTSFVEFYGEPNNQTRTSYLETIDWTRGYDYKNDDFGWWIRTRKIHGIFQILGWMVMLPIGIIVARYGRHQVPQWFYVHLGFQMAGFLMITIGGIVGLYLFHGTTGNHFVSLHARYGAIAIALALFQVAALVLRPKEDSSLRERWNVWHRSMGIFACFFGAITVITGCNLVGLLYAPWSMFYFLVVVLTAVITVLEIRMRKNKRSNIIEQPHPPVMLSI